MARLGRVGCWVGGIGCLLGLVLLAGGALLGLSAVQVASGEEDVGGFDMRRFDLFGLSDAMECRLEPVAMRLVDDRLEVAVDLVRGGDLDRWDWTVLQIEEHTVRLFGLPDELREPDWSSSFVDGPYGRRTRLVFRVEQPPVARGELVTLELEVRIAAEGMGGMTSINTNRSLSCDLGTAGTWFDHRLEPVSGELGGPEAEGGGR